MDANNYRTELLLIAAARLAKSHGVFFAAALLADFNVSFNDALRALSAPAELRDPTAIACLKVRTRPSR